TVASVYHRQIFATVPSAQENWNRLKGFELLTLVVEQVEEEASDRNVA
ncbi:hypothetical protein ACZ87_02929, partial [Candidatus Erwinia dacicola]